ncbi:hypothetical protein HHI36_003781 [Cryptolaemus montrouzieri]|uniref:C2H2-type domain-containing protein n=1 Tax=Cryptolaemus montrouzieri TaxID=559131 RepID=A0ABD2NP68_9CUCU
MNLCRACFDFCEKPDLFPVEGDLKDILKFCISELNLEITENPVLCKACESTLKIVNDFKLKCLATQKKILIFTKQSIPQPVDLRSEENYGTSTPSKKVVKKVAPFKLNLKSRASEPAKNVNLRKSHSRKRRNSQESFVPIAKALKNKSSGMTIQDDQEDILNLLDNSVNVIESKLETSSTLVKIEEANISSLNENEDKKKPKSNLSKKIFKTHGKFHPHMNSVKMINKAEMNLQCFKCENCAFVSKYQIGLNKHRLLCPKRDHLNGDSESIKGTSEKSTDSESTNQKMYSCKLCSYVTEVNRSLAVHISRKHRVRFGGKKKKFAIKLALSKKAQEQSEEIKNFLCPIEGCNRSFNTHKGSLIHQSHHFNVKKSCPLCNKIFESDRGMHIHMKMHKNEAELKKSSSDLQMPVLQAEAALDIENHNVDSNNLENSKTIDQVGEISTGEEVETETLDGDENSELQESPASEITSESPIELQPTDENQEACTLSQDTIISSQVE